jgi:hypothetical protein
MAVNDVVWKNGTAEVFESTGSEITVYWKDGTAYVQHEYTEISADNSGSGAINLQLLESAGTGAASPPVFSGSGAIDLPLIESTSTGTATVPMFSGNGTIDLPLIEAAGSGTMIVPTFSGSGAIDLPLIEVAGGDAPIAIVGLQGNGISIRIGIGIF